MIAKFNDNVRIALDLATEIVLTLWFTVMEKP